MKNILLTVIFFFSITMLGGCASIIRGTEDKISINSLENDTTIIIDSIPRGRDSATVSVERGKNHKIIASKDGCVDASITTGKKIDQITFLGILIDLGFFSIPYDFISGAIWKTHPSTYTLTPECPSSGNNTSAPVKP